MRDLLGSCMGGICCLVGRLDRWLSIFFLQAMVVLLDLPQARLASSCYKSEQSIQNVWRLSKEGFWVVPSIPYSINGVIGSSSMGRSQIYKYCEEPEQGNHLGNTTFKNCNIKGSTNFIVHQKIIFHMSRSHQYPAGDDGCLLYRVNSQFNPGDTSLSYQLRKWRPIFQNRHDSSFEQTRSINVLRGMFSYASAST